MMWSSKVLITRLLPPTPWWRFLTIFLVWRVLSQSLFQRYVFNTLFKVGVVLSPSIILLLVLLSNLLASCWFSAITHTLLWFQQPRSLSATPGGPVNALVVIAQSQLQVAQAVGPRLDRDIQAYLQLVRNSL